MIGGSVMTIGTVGGEIPRRRPQEPQLAAGTVREHTRKSVNCYSVTYISVANNMSV